MKGVGAAATGSFVALWAAVSQLESAQALTSASGIPCPSEVFACFGDPECQTCLEPLQGLQVSTVGSDAVDCNSLYTDVCTIIEEGGCDSSNPNLITLAQCVAEDEYDCIDFTSCNFVFGRTPAPVVATEAPVLEVTAAPTVAATPAATTSRGVADDDATGEDGDTAGSANGGSVAFAASTAGAFVCGAAALYLAF